MLRYNRSTRLQETLFIYKQNPIRKLESWDSQFFVKKWKLLAYHLEDLRVPQVGNPCITVYTVPD